MARAGRAGTLWAALATALSLAAALPLAAATGNRTGARVDDLRARLGALDSALSRDTHAAGRSLSDLLTRHGLDHLSGQLAAEERIATPERPVRLTVPDRPAMAGTSDLRLPLAILSQSYSDEDNGDVLAAPGGADSQVLSFRSGIVTLADLQAAGALRPAAPGGVSAPGGGGGVVLVRPVVLEEDTLLRLDPGTRLALSRPGGAFVISLGQVEIRGTELSVTGGANPHSTEFVPFLTVAGGGRLIMEDSSVHGLGFGWTEKFSGVSVAAHPFMRPLGISRVERSRLDRVVSLALSGTPGARVLDNRFHDVRDNALRLSRAPGARVQGNLFHGSAPTNSIRLLDGTGDAVLSGNMLLGGRRAGILIGQGSDRVRVVGNVIWRREGAAIKFLRTSCGHVAMNIALDGRQKGIEVRESRGTLVHRNLISGSHSSAIWISGQPQGAVTHLTHNILAGNGEGLATATAQRIVLMGNDLTGQMPRLVSGDLVPVNAVVARDLKGREPVLLTAGGRADVPQMPGVCGGEGQ
ncbi:NosD domain-containing protein [Marinibacterium sp. SX1]|uniref:NosD domain-containing protein n=1 Tax=Marinibacterium sp. SX1 TaxID=3388424 RepID=UPI003D17AF35